LWGPPASRFASVAGGMPHPCNPRLRNCPSTALGSGSREAGNDRPRLRRRADRCAAPQTDGQRRGNRFRGGRGISLGPGRGRAGRQRRRSIRGGNGGRGLGDHGSDRHSGWRCRRKPPGALDQGNGGSQTNHRAIAAGGPRNGASGDAQSRGNSRDYKQHPAPGSPGELCRPGMWRRAAQLSTPD
jgi:hypothetical protein